MISARHRFHGRGSLMAVYSRGQTVRAPAMSLKFATRPRGKKYRVAVVVSRKVHKSAVVRNRIRRRVYETVRWADESLLTSKDLVFTVFSEQIAGIEQPKLTALVNDLLQKASAKTLNSAQTSVEHAIVDKRTGKKEQ